MLLKRTFQVAPLALVAATAACSAVVEPQPAQEKTAGTSSELRGSSVTADSADEYAHVGTFQAPYRSFDAPSMPVPPPTGQVLGAGVMLSCNSVLTTASIAAELTRHRALDDQVRFTTETPAPALNVPVDPARGMVLDTINASQMVDGNTILNLVAAGNKPEYMSMASKDLAIIRLPKPLTHTKFFAKVADALPADLCNRICDSPTPDCCAGLPVVGYGPDRVYDAYGQCAQPDGNREIGWSGLLHRTTSTQDGHPLAAEMLATIRSDWLAMTFDTGDAAAPLFDAAVGGGTSLLGVAAFGQYMVNVCNASDWNFFVNVTQFKDWVQQQLASLDTDGDSIPDACDNCKWVKNPDQTDTDGNGIGDDCDPCKGHGWDFDHDGICDDFDLCRGVASTDNTNSNALSESFHSPDRIWADACDPVPVPAAQVVPSASMKESGCALSGSGLVLCYLFGRISNNELAISPLGSHQAPEGGDGPITKSFVSVPNVDTSFRFCQKARPVSNDPPCDNFDAVQDYHLMDAPSAADENFTQPYHRITMRTGLFAPGVRGATFQYDYDRASIDSPNPHKARWDFESDYQFWFDNGTLAYLPPADGDASPAPPASFASGLDGLMWLHANTAVGDTVNVGTGLHGDQLANSYTPMDPESPHVSVGGHWIQVPPLEYARWPINWTANPFPWLGRFEAPLVVSAGSGILGVMTHEGEFVDVSDRFGPTLRASLTGSGHWVSPAEPQSDVGNQNPISGLVISADGSRVLDTMRLSSDGSRMLGTADMEERVPEDSASSLSGWRSLIQRSDALIPARSGFAAVFSRQLDTLFVLGGVDTSGNTLHDIWVVSPQDGVHELTTSIDLGKITAAAYSFPDRALYVLDEIKKGPGGHARLLRVDAMAGTVSVVGTWPTFHFQERQWLVADRDGGILVVGIRHAVPKATTIVRIDVQTARVTDVVLSSLALALPPVVDRAGYGLLWENRKGGGVSYERRASLEGAHGTLLDVGRCF